MPRRDTGTTVVLLRGDAEVASWPLDARGPIDLSVIDELARVQLAAQRLGYRIRLRNACQELQELLHVAGLAQVIASATESVVEVGRQPERREERGIDEVVVPDDPVA